MRTKRAALAVALAAALLAPLTSGTAQAKPHPPGTPIPLEYCGQPNGTPSRVFAAAAAIQELGRGKYRDSYTGQRPCSPPRRFAVFRVANPALDREMRALARKHHVRVEFVDAPISYAEMHRIGEEVVARAERLKRAGAPFQRMSHVPEGFLVLGVDGDPKAAHRVLRDLDHLYITRAKVTPA